MNGGRGAREQGAEIYVEQALDQMTGRIRMY